MVKMGVDFWRGGGDRVTFWIYLSLQCLVDIYVEILNKQLVIRARSKLEIHIWELSSYLKP